MSRTIEVRVGDDVLLVETVQGAGSEMTSGRAEKAAAQTLAAFERAQSAIVHVATSTVQAFEHAAGRAARPDRLELEFGVKFSASGDLIVAGVAGQASLVVRLVYEKSKSKPGGE